MLLSYVIAFDQLMRQSRARSKEALAEPLDAPEWQGVAPLIERIAGFRAQRRLKESRDQQSDPEDCARDGVPAQPAAIGHAVKTL